MLTKGLTKDLMNKIGILNGAKFLSSGMFQNCLVFILAKNTLNISVALLRLIRGNLMECQKKILKTTKSDRNFAPTFLDHHLLQDITFNGHCLINNIFIPKKSNKSIYFLHTDSMVKKFKHRFYIK